MALSEEENLMAKLFQYRFPSIGSLSGHSFGNLFITAMTAIAGGFDEGIAKSSEVLAIRGKVLPATLSSVSLNAELDDGCMVCGETNISKADSRIKRLTIMPSNPPAAPEVISTIKNSDCIVMGPGSLYTSVISNLLVAGISESIRDSKAVKIYVCNIMTQPNETNGFTLSDHIKAIKEHVDGELMDYCIVNTGKINQSIRKRYIRQKSHVVRADAAKVKGIRVVRENLVADDVYARHDPVKLAAAVMKLYMRARGKNNPVSDRASL